MESWKEIVAYYLYKADSSKFLKENYAKKRKVSVRSMSMKINMFGELERGGKPKSESAHAQGIIDEYGSLPVDNCLKWPSQSTGWIHGGTPTQESVESAATEAVIRKEATEELEAGEPENTVEDTPEQDQGSSSGRWLKLVTRAVKA